MSKKPLCLHCHERQVNRPRGLCWKCWHLPGVKEQYASQSKYDPDEDPPVRKPDHQVGEPLWRCLWCSRFLCSSPMDLCQDCEADYRERSRDML